MPNHLLRDETELKQVLTEFLNTDFHIKPEVPGRFLVDGTPVIIDLLLFPKRHLIERGFDEGYVGIEVKGVPKTRQKKKALDVAWQAVTYSQSEFETKSGFVRPIFVLIYPEIQRFFAHDDPHAYGWIYVSSLLVRSNVGHIELDSKKDTWLINFHSVHYFHSIRGKGPHHLAGTKRRVGTRK
jgi:hypothetical protein